MKKNRPKGLKYKIKVKNKAWFKKGENFGKNNPAWKGGRIIHKGYVLLIKHGHSMSGSRGRIKEHRLVMSDYLGRDLKSDEVIHHINNNKLDNRIENLLLFENHSKHRKYESSKKRILVAGAGGFVGGHLVSFLKSKKYWVRGVDIKLPEFKKTDADEFLQLDLRNYNNCLKATKGIQEVYTLAADMGGMLYIANESIAPLNNSNLINTYIPQACFYNNVKKLFFSSSACVYPIHKQDKLNSSVMVEKDVYPANPNEAYGWEKLIAEQRYLAYQQERGLEVRIARFENTYGPEGTYKGGREKAPAALCRKVALAEDGGEIEVWGDGKAQRSFMYIDDCVEGIYRLMKSNYRKPINLGSPEVVSINELASMIIAISGKKLKIKHIPGPEGVRSRRISHAKAESFLNWKTKICLMEGIEKTYQWIEKQMR